MDLDMDTLPSNSLGEAEDEMTTIRALLRPPPIPGTEAWGIPDAPDGEVNPAVAATIQKFFSLKRPPPVNGSTPASKHFNDSLIQNRSFRNPHLYKKLVDWAGIDDEKISNFPPDVWDASGSHGALLPEYYADNVASQQKAKEEKRERAQASSCHSTRTIDFASSTASRGSHQASSSLYRPSTSKIEERGRRVEGGKGTRWGQ